MVLTLKTVAPIRENNSTLVEASFYKRLIGNHGALVLSGALRTNTTVRVLDLTDNDVGNAGAIALASILCHNRSLEMVDLYKNNIRTKGAAALARSLQQHTTLKTLWLASNPIGECVFKLFANAMAKNTTLTELWLDKPTKANEGYMRQIERHLQSNRNKDELYYKKMQRLGRLGTKTKAARSQKSRAAEHT